MRRNRFERLDAGEHPYLTNIVGAVVGAIASAGASSLMGKMFGGGGGNSKAVDRQYAQLIAAQQAMAKQMWQKGTEMEQWARSVYEGLDQETKEILARLDPMQAETAALASGLQDVPSWIAGVGEGLAETGERVTGYGDEALERHREMYQPVEQEWLDRYREYNTPEYAAQREAAAAADVTQAFDAQRENALRQLEGYGIDPGQARHGALDLNVRLAEAAQKALMQTQERNAVQAEQDAMRKEILEYGSQYPEWAQQFLQQGMAGTEAGGQLGNTATQAGENVAGIYGKAADINVSGGALANETARTGAGLMDVPGRYYSGAGDALSGASSSAGGRGAIDTSSSRYDQVAGDIGTALGTAAGDWWNKRSEDKGSSGSSYGGAVGSLLPGRQLLATGGEVQGPGGPYTDSVPIQASDGEYMIPYEVVHRKGTEFFDKLISKTRDEMQALPV